MTYLLALLKVYPICLFASLNSRIVIGREMNNHVTYVSPVRYLPRSDQADHPRVDILTPQTGASLSLPSSEALSKNVGHSGGAVSYNYDPIERGDQSVDVKVSLSLSPCHTLKTRTRADGPRRNNGLLFAVVTLRHVAA